MLPRLLTLLFDGRIEPAKRLQIPQQIIQIAVAQSVRTKHRHGRLAAGLHRFHFVLLVALNALATVHDLDREQVLVLLDALDRRAVGRRDGDRLETGAMLLTYGLSGILDWGFGRLSYLSMREECRLHPATCSGTSSTPSTSPVSVSLNTDGQSHVMATVSGTF